MPPKSYPIQSLVANLRLFLDINCTLLRGKEVCIDITGASSSDKLSNAFAALPLGKRDVSTGLGAKKCVKIFQLKGFLIKRGAKFRKSPIS